MNKLEEMELEFVEELEKAGAEYPEVKESYRITDLSSLNWCFRKLKALESKENEIKDLVKEELERIAGWEQQETKSIIESRKYFESLIEAYYREEKAKDPKFKASTPYGKLSSRKQQPKWEYKDEVLKNWIYEHGLVEFIRTKDEVDKESLKKAVTVKDGRAYILVDASDEDLGNKEFCEFPVEGITVTEQEEKVTYKVL